LILTNSNTLELYGLEKEFRNKQIYEKVAPEGVYSCSNSCGGVKSPDSTGSYVVEAKLSDKIKDMLRMTYQDSENNDNGSRQHTLWDML
jgi:hypothetical protein